jgi:hypothetical protein
MRLKTIWTLRSMSTMERLRRTREWATMELASRLPKNVRYWVTVQELAKATKNHPGHVMGAHLDEILQNLDGPK